MNVSDHTMTADSLAGFTLTIDTAGPACQAVVSVGPSIIAFESKAMQRGHGEELVPMVERVLAKASIGYEDLNRLGVTIGPGSFTGIRVGLAAARSFSATLNIPVVGIGTLEALALSDRLDHTSSAVRAVALDARNGLVYAQRFGAGGVPLEEPDVMADLVFSASLTGDVRLVGPAQPIIAALMRSAGKRMTLGQTSAVPSPQALADLAQSGKVGDKPTPLYLKSADAAPAKPAGLRARTF